MLLDLRAEWWIADTCIYGTANIYRNPPCDVYGAAGSITSLATANTFMTPGAEVVVQCALENISLAEYAVRTKRDVGSVVKEMPSTAQIVEMAKVLLSL